MSICYLGPVYEHRLMMEHTGANRGYGYVRFTNTEVRESECYSYRVLFLTVPPNFQYQNEKQVAANQDYFFKKFSM